MNETPHIHIVGSVNVDFIIQTETLPRAGETVTGGVFSTAPGGKGANQALAARRLGARVSMSACVGADAYADIALANLIAEGVELSGLVRKPDVATGAAFINVSGDGENQITVASGANAAFSAHDVSASAADAVIAQLEVPVAVVEAAVSANDTFFVLNTAPALDISDGLLRRANVLVMNETESAFYGDRLNDYSGVIVRTYGAAGAAIFRGGQEIARAEPPAITVVDTTGAGDCFTAALTVALIGGMSDGEALQFACAAAALATTKLGAQAGSPRRDEVEALLA